MSFKGTIQALALLPLLQTIVLAQDGRFIVTGMQTAVNTTSGQRPTRMNINQLQNSGGASWDLFILGLSEFQQVRESDEKSYFGISGIHGRPYIPWNGVAAAANGNGRGYCPHGEILFASWHRPYVAVFEQVLGQHIANVAARYQGGDAAAYRAAAESWRMPYWDWATDFNLPPSTTTPSITVNGPTGRTTIKNPLYSYKWQQFPLNTASNYFPTSTDRNCWGWPETTRQPDNSGNNQFRIVNQNLADTNNPLKGQVYRVMSTVTDFNTMATFGTSGLSFEAPHNDVHTSSYAIMTYLDYSGFDPIFWLHHTNVDRLIALWQTVNYNNTVQTGSYRTRGLYATPANSIITADSDLKPFYRDDNNFHTGRTAASTKNFGYTYPELVNDWAATPDQMRRSVIRSVNILYGDGSMANQPDPAVQPVASSSGTALPSSSATQAPSDSAAQPSTSGTADEDDGGDDGQDGQNQDQDQDQDSQQTPAPAPAPAPVPAPGPAPAPASRPAGKSKGKARSVPWSDWSWLFGGGARRMVKRDPTLSDLELIPKILDKVMPGITGGITGGISGGFSSTLGGDGGNYGKSAATADDYGSGMAKHFKKPSSSAVGDYGNNKNSNNKNSNNKNINNKNKAAAASPLKPVKKYSIGVEVERSELPLPCTLVFSLGDKHIGRTSFLSMPMEGTTFDDLPLDSAIKAAGMNPVDVTKLNDLLTAHIRLPNGTIVADANVPSLKVKVRGEEVKPSLSLDEFPTVVKKFFNGPTLTGLKCKIMDVVSDGFNKNDMDGAYGNSNKIDNNNNNNNNISQDNTDYGNNGPLAPQSSVETVNQLLPSSSSSAGPSTTGTPLAQQTTLTPLMPLPVTSSNVPAEMTLSTAPVIPASETPSTAVKPVVESISSNVPVMENQSAAPTTVAPTAVAPTAAASSATAPTPPADMYTASPSLPAQSPTTAAVPASETPSSVVKPVESTSANVPALKSATTTSPADDLYMPSPTTVVVATSGVPSSSVVQPFDSTSANVPAMESATTTTSAAVHVYTPSTSTVTSLSTSTVVEHVQTPPVPSAATTSAAQDTYTPAPSVSPSTGSDVVPASETRASSEVKPLESTSSSSAPVSTSPAEEAHYPPSPAMPQGTTSVVEAVGSTPSASAPPAADEDDYPPSSSASETTSSAVVPGSVTPTSSVEVVSAPSSSAAPTAPATDEDDYPPSSSASETTSSAVVPGSVTPTSSVEVVSAPSSSAAPTAPATDEDDYPPAPAAPETTSSAVVPGSVTPTSSVEVVSAPSSSAAPTAPATDEDDYPPAPAASETTSSAVVPGSVAPTSPVEVVSAPSSSAAPTAPATDEDDYPPAPAASETTSSAVVPGSVAPTSPVEVVSASSSSAAPTVPPAADMYPPSPPAPQSSSASSAVVPVNETPSTTVVAQPTDNGDSYPPTSPQTPPANRGDYALDSAPVQSSVMYTGEKAPAKDSSNSVSSGSCGAAPAAAPAPAAALAPAAPIVAAKPALYVARVAETPRMADAAGAAGGDGAGGAGPAPASSAEATAQTPNGEMFAPSAPKKNTGPGAVKNTPQGAVFAPSPAKGTALSRKARRDALHARTLSHLTGLVGELGEIGALAGSFGPGPAAGTAGDYAPAANDNDDDMKKNKNNHNNNSNSSNDDQDVDDDNDYDPATTPTTQDSPAAGDYSSPAAVANMPSLDHLGAAIAAALGSSSPKSLKGLGNIGAYVQAAKAAAAGGNFAPSSDTAAAPGRGSSSSDDDHDDDNNNMNDNYMAAVKAASSRVSYASRAQAAASRGNYVNRVQAVPVGARRAGNNVYF